jgi:hypothetical protein
VTRLIRSGRDGHAPGIVAAQERAKNPESGIDHETTKGRKHEKIIGQVLLTSSEDSLCIESALDGLSSASCFRPFVFS